jgi:hypothetical protein
MNNDNINFKIKKIAVDRVTQKNVVLLQPSNQDHIEDYHYDIRLLSKDFLVEEIHEGLHFIYADDIKSFFNKHQEAKISDIPLRLQILNEAVLTELV